MKELVVIWLCCLVVFQSCTIAKLKQDKRSLDAQLLSCEAVNEYIK